MKKPLKFSVLAVISMVLSALTGTVAFAADSNPYSNLLPPAILQILGIAGTSGVCATQYVNNRARLAFFLILGALVLVSVVYSVLAAFKYITSQGDPGKIEEANKSIKAIFMGIAAMVVGIVGMIIVFVVLGAKPTNPALFQTCINGPASAGCKACQENLNSDLCVACEAQYDLICNSGTSPENANLSADAVKDYFVGEPLQNCVSRTTN